MGGNLNTLKDLIITHESKVPGAGQIVLAIVSGINALQDIGDRWPGVIDGNQEDIAAVVVDVGSILIAVASVIGPASKVTLITQGAVAAVGALLDSIQLVTLYSETIDA